MVKSLGWLVLKTWDFYFCPKNVTALSKLCLKRLPTMSWIWLTGKTSGNPVSKTPGRIIYIINLQEEDITRITADPKLVKLWSWICRILLFKKIERFKNGADWHVLIKETANFQMHLKLAWDHIIWIYSYLEPPRETKKQFALLEVFNLACIFPDILHFFMFHFNLNLLLKTFIGCW